MYDSIIIGAGPAGVTAAIYLKRAGLNALIIEATFPGGQTASAAHIENYPGFVRITGAKFANQLGVHTRSLGVEMLNEQVERVDFSGEIKSVFTSSGEHKAKTVIVATGAKSRLLGVKGEAELSGSGVSYCATCDGNFFKGMDVAVVGGGNTALEDAIYLSNLCTSVTLIHRRDQFRADQAEIDRVRAKKNVKMELDSTVDSIDGEFGVDSVTIRNKHTDAVKTIPVQGVFVAVGQQPDTSAFKDYLNIDAGGYIIADEKTQTNIPGVYAAGDVRVKELRQIVTAVSDGALSAYYVAKYIDARAEAR
ncbi:MAG: thioredoxin-disulfide reductase [Christensenellales bacterium]|jgi:thioredoxin reductase (NADPH)